MIGIQALTGYHPEELLKDIYTDEIIWRDKKRVSSYLAEVLDIMVRHRFWQRYPSATEVLQDIKDRCQRLRNQRLRNQRLLSDYLQGFS